MLNLGQQKNAKNIMLNGETATRQSVDTTALYKVRAAMIVTPLNAPSQNYRAHIPDNKTMTDLQERVMQQKKATVMGAPVAPNTTQDKSAIWTGARFTL